MSDTVSAVKKIQVGSSVYDIQIPVDNALDINSENPLTNAAVTEALSKVPGIHLINSTQDIDNLYPAEGESYIQNYVLVGNGELTSASLSSSLPSNIKYLTCYKTIDKTVENKFYYTQIIVTNDDIYIRQGETLPNPGIAGDSIFWNITPIKSIFQTDRWKCVNDISEVQNPQNDTFYFVRG